MAKQFKRKSNGVSESKKRGRQELRKVTRTAARKQQQDENHEDDLNVNNDSQEDNSEKRLTKKMKKVRETIIEEKHILLC